MVTFFTSEKKIRETEKKNLLARLDKISYILLVDLLSENRIYYYYFTFSYAAIEKKILAVVQF